MKAARKYPIVAILLAGCLPRAAVREPGSPGTESIAVHREPRMVEASMTCDADDSIWTFLAVTDAWTDGGWVWLSDDGSYVESHRVPSVAAARDGSADDLALELPLAVDWRDDEGTAFSCASAPAGQFFVLATDGVVSDCRSWGDPAIFAGVPGAQTDCETPL